MKSSIKKSPNKVLDVISNVKSELSSKSEIVVGLPEGAADYPDGTSVVMVGTAHEFGLGNPERSFLRSTLADNKTRYLSKIKKGGSLILSGSESKDSILEKVGQIVESDVKARIVSIKSPPNTAQTIARKGSSNPLVDTSHMIGQIKYEVV